MSVKLDNAHWDTPKDHFRYPFKQRVTRQEIKELLLNSKGEIIRDGKIHSMKSNKIGFGVYEIWFEEKEYK